MSEEHSWQTGISSKLKSFYESKEWPYTEGELYRLKVLEVLRLKFAHWQKTKIVLDVGCFKGATMSYLREITGETRIIGIDVSRSALLEARKADGFDYIHASAESLPLRSEIFDGALCLGVIEHLPHPKQFMKELGRVLNDFGVCLVFIPNEVTSCRGIARKLLRKLLCRVMPILAELVFPEQGHLHFLTPASFGALCGESGFKILSTYCDAFIWMEIPFTVIFDRIHPRLKFFIKKFVSPLMKYKFLLWFTDSMVFYVKPNACRKG